MTDSTVTATKSNSETIHLARRALSQISNWYSAGLLTAVTLPTRVPPRRGLGGTWLARQRVTFRLRDGSRISCRLQDAGAILDVYVDGCYEFAGIPWQGLKAVCDVGAHVGTFSVWISRRSPSARIVAMEPNPAVWPFLVRNVATNRIANRIELVNYGMGGARGVGSLEVRDYSTAARLAPEGKGAPVKITTLAEIMQEQYLGGLDLLKLDTEGAEYERLLGAKTELLDRIGIILCEFHPVAPYK